MKKIWDARKKCGNYLYIIIFLLLAFLSHFVYAQGATRYYYEYQQPGSIGYSEGSVCLNFPDIQSNSISPIIDGIYNGSNNSNYRCNRYGYFFDGVYAGQWRWYNMGISAINCNISDTVYFSGNSYYCSASPHCVDGVGDCNYVSLEDDPGVNDGPPDCPAGNPINIANGNKFQQEDDFLDPLDSLSFSRFYNSSTGLWTSSFAAQLFVSELERVRVKLDNGRTIPFTYDTVNTTNFYYPVWNARDGDAYSLSRTTYGSNNNWFVTDPEGSNWEFDVSGKLVKITNKANESLSLVHSYPGQLLTSTITDKYGRSIVVSYDSEGRVISFIDTASNVYSYTYSGAQLTSVTYPGGTQRTYHYEDTNDAMLLTGITDENGVRFATWNYDSQGRAIHSEHASVEDVDLTFNTDGTVTATNSLGKNTTYTFQVFEGKLQPTEVSGAATSSCVAANMAYTYDSNGYRLTKTDWKGNITETIRNGRGLIEEERTGLSYSAGPGSTLVDSPESQKEVTTWDLTWALPTQKIFYTYASGNYVAYRQEDFVYDAQNRLDLKTVTDLTSFTTPYTTNGNTQVWDYSYTYWDSPTNTQLQSMTVDGPRTSVNDVVVTLYTAQGYLDKKANALGHEIEVTSHDGAGRPLTLIDANGVLTTLTYLARGWLNSITIENGVSDAVTTIGYDNAGQITDVTLPNGVNLHYDYDSAHRLYQITDGDGNSLLYTLDNAGNITKEEVFDSGSVLQRSVDNVFDELNRLRNTIGATDSQENLLGYDVNDNLTTSQLGGTSGNNPVTRLYDSLDRIKQIAHADGGNSYYSYNALDLLTSVTDQNGYITSYQYDGLSNLMQVVSPDTGTTTYSYDDAGNRTSQTDARGVSSQYSYDALNRLTTLVYPASTTENVTYAYDDISAGNKGVGQLTGIIDSSGSTQYVYNGLGQLEGKTVTLESTVYNWAYEYNLAGDLMKIFYPSGREVRYERNTLAQISAVYTKANAAATEELVVNSMNYKPFGPLSSYTYGNGITQSTGYDVDYRVNTIDAQGSSNLLDLTYDYWLTSNISDITDGIDSAKDQSFTYDHENRLTVATGQYGQLNYQYDNVGNRLQKTQADGANTTTDTYTYDNVSNQLDSVASNDGSTTNQRDFLYSATGNLIQDIKQDGTVLDLSYNHANRYKELDQNTTLRALYLYNALGQRVVKNAASVGTINDHYHYNEQGRLLAVTTTTGIPKREFIYLDNLQIAALIDDAYATEWASWGNEPDTDSDGIPDSSDNCPVDANPNQTDDDSNGIGNVCDSQQLTVDSIGAEDGWTRESGENTDVGGKKNNTGTGNKAIRFGDYRNNRQYKAILSFDLSAIPVGSALSSVNLQLTRTNGSIVGDTSGLGAASIDLKTGGFSNNAALENADFEAPASVMSVGTIIDGLTATANIVGVGLAAIQIAKNSGEHKVQLRLQYAIDDDNDSTDDYTSYYSGSTSNASRHPKLIVDYTLAD